ncbi:MAG TPA: D-alanyl-D-alanine carboxypeptidase family protein [Actinomycetota bacterium]|nr:D-alanyl-D-alanine carboxypeptidase family protein [Actinomycetota bacterium]
MRRRVAAAALAVVPSVVLVLALLAGSTALSSLGLQAGPPPTPVPPNGSPSPFLDRLSTPGDARTVPRVVARSAMLVDLGSDQVLFQRDPGRPRPVASLTKLMTALIVLDREAGRLHRRVRVHPDAVFGRNDYGAGSTLGLRAGERISVRDLLEGLLLGSANDAAEALAIEEAGSESAFVERMNARARALGMLRTRFASPHGLDDRGRSSAADLLVLLRAAWRDPALRELVGERFASVRSNRVTRRRIQNRNVLLWLYRGATGVKTGYTADAGYCLIATARRDDRELAVVVLGGREEVFSDAASLLNHGFAAFRRRTLVDEGEALGSVRIRGGSVPVVAGERLDALVRVGQEAAIERLLRGVPSAAYPPPTGSVVGTLRLDLAGAPVGRVPVVAADLAPPEEPSGSWWSRAAAAVSGAVASVIGALTG